MGQCSNGQTQLAKKNSGFNQNQTNNANIVTFFAFNSLSEKSTNSSGNSIDQAKIQKQYTSIICTKLDQLQYDPNNIQSKSYQLTNKNTISKITYNWHAFPIVTQLNLRYNNQFTVKNISVLDDNFVIGVIKQSALKDNSERPWKFGHVVCFESHIQRQQNGIIYDNNVRQCGYGIKKGQSISCIIRPYKIAFKIGNKIVGEITFAEGFAQQKLLPYVALFSPGDKVQIQAQVTPV